MDKDTKRRAIELPVEKRDYPTITYSSIELQTGHDRGQPVIPGMSIGLSGPEEAPGHGNEGRKPRSAAKAAEPRHCARRGRHARASR